MIPVTYEPLEKGKRMRTVAKGEESLGAHVHGGLMDAQAFAI